LIILSKRRLISNKLNKDGLVKSRYTREGGYPWTIQLLEKNGFPIKDFGNDDLKTDFLRNHQQIKKKEAQSASFLKS
jgi:hypothetical protein